MDHKAKTNVLKEYDGYLKKWSNKIFLPNHAFDDILQELRMVALDAAEDFREEKGVKFITFLTTYIKNWTAYKIKYYNALKRSKKSEGKSLDTVIPYTDYNDIFYLSAVVDKDNLPADQKDAIDEMASTIIQYFIKHKYNWMIMPIIRGEKTQSEMAKEAGVSRQAVSEIYNKALNKFRDQYKEELEAVKKYLR